MFEIVVSIVISLLTIVISTFVSYTTTKKTLDMDKKSLDSSNDLVIYQILLTVKKDVEDAVYKYAQSKDEVDKLFIEVKKESFVNALELQCKYYIENKIDRQTFRDIYKNDLVIVKDSKYAKFYEHLSQYQNTIILDLLR